MTNRDKEATLKEVLSVVTLADLGRELKGISALLGCYLVFILIAAVVQLIFTGVTPSATGWKIPSWVYWLAGVWLFVGFYTSDKSYHEHRIALYLPRMGFLWDAPVAAYIVGGFYLIGAITNAMGESAISGIAWFALYSLWFLPAFAFLAAIEVGHKKLMELRADNPELR